MTEESDSLKKEVLRVLLALFNQMWQSRKLPDTEAHRELRRGGAQGDKSGSGTSPKGGSAKTPEGTRRGPVPKALKESLAKWRAQRSEWPEQRLTATSKAAFRDALRDLKQAWENGKMQLSGESSQPTQETKRLGEFDMEVGRQILEELQGLWPELVDGGESSDAAVETVGGLPREFGDYRVIRKLGSGGMGEVYLARHSSLGHQVALKVLSPARAADPQTVKRLLREARAAGTIDHPSIISVFEAGTFEGKPYIAMRYVEGETLAAKIRRAREEFQVDPKSSHLRLEAPAAEGKTKSASGTDSSRAPSTRAEIFQLLWLFERVARGLHLAHEAGLLHRDLKPSNIMVSRDGEPVILDLGLARTETTDSQQITQPGDFFGTLPYMSPEQLLANRLPLDRRTDIYSLGVTLYECLTLELPFDETQRETLYHAILNKIPPNPRSLNPRIPRDLKVVLETALDRDRGRRYDTALEFAEDLRRIRESEQILARPISPLTRVQRWVQRRPALTTALVAVAIIAFLSALFTLGYPTRVLPDAGLFKFELAGLKLDQTAHRFDYYVGESPGLPSSVRTKLSDPQIALDKVWAIVEGEERVDLRVYELRTVDWTPLFDKLKAWVKKNNRSDGTSCTWPVEVHAKILAFLPSTIRADLFFHLDRTKPTIQSVSVRPLPARTGGSSVPIQPGKAYALPGRFSLEVLASDDLQLTRGIARLHGLGTEPRVKTFSRGKPGEPSLQRQGIAFDVMEDQGQFRKITVSVVDFAGNETTLEDLDIDLLVNLWEQTEFSGSLVRGNRYEVRVTTPGGVQIPEGMLLIHVSEKPLGPEALGPENVRAGELRPGESGEATLVLSVPLEGEKPQHIRVHTRHLLSTRLDPSAPVPHECFVPPEPPNFVDTARLVLTLESPESPALEFSLGALRESGLLTETGGTEGETGETVTCAGTITLKRRPTHVRLEHEKPEAPCFHADVEGPVALSFEEDGTLLACSTVFRLSSLRSAAQREIQLRLIHDPRAPAELSHSVAGRDGHSVDVAWTRTRPLWLGSGDRVTLSWEPRPGIQRIRVRLRDNVPGERGELELDRASLGNLNGPWRLDLPAELLPGAGGGARRGSVSYDVTVQDFFGNSKTYGYTLHFNPTDSNYFVDTVSHCGIKWRHIKEGTYVTQSEISYRMLQGLLDSPELDAKEKDKLRGLAVDILKPAPDLGPKGDDLPVVNVSIENAHQIARALGWRLVTRELWKSIQDESASRLRNVVRATAQEESGVARRAVYQLHEDILKTENLLFDQSPSKEIQELRARHDSILVPVGMPESGVGEKWKLFGGLEQFLGNVREYVVDYENQDDPASDLEVARGYIAGLKYNDSFYLEPREGVPSLLGASLSSGGRVTFRNVPVRNSELDSPANLTSSNGYTGFRFVILAGRGDDTDFDWKSLSP